MKTSDEKKHQLTAQQNSVIIQVIPRLIRLRRDISRILSEKIQKIPQLAGHIPATYSNTGNIIVAVLDVKLLLVNYSVTKIILAARMLFISLSTCLSVCNSVCLKFILYEPCIQ